MKRNEAALMVVRHLRNAFEKSSEKGRFAIDNGTITLSNRYASKEWIAITGSKHNNGIYQIADVLPSRRYQLGNGTDDECPVTDEKFKGTAWRLCFPSDFLSLCEEIRKWLESNQPSNVVSESVVGFYSKTVAADKDGIPVGWDKVFAPRLHGSWRKMWESELVSSL